MSDDASYELQRAIVQLLKADAAVSALVGNRIYDVVPRDPTTKKVTAAFPYISLGEDQETPENAECIRASEFVLPIDVWSREPGYREGKRIARAVEDALEAVDLPLSDNAQVYFEYDGRRSLRDPDGLTSHIAMNFRAGIDKP